jgi:outer membrane lipoprotein SlyB
MTRLFKKLAALLGALALAACASAPPGAGLNGTGVVQSISETQKAGSGSGLAGSIGGAVVGGALGSLVGGGTGRTIATGVGAVVGGTAGGAAGAQAGATTVWNVSIRFDDGIDRVIQVEQPPTYRNGARVRVTNGMIQAL